jgi:hypothetical protein
MLRIASYERRLAALERHLRVSWTDARDEVFGDALRRVADADLDVLEEIFRHIGEDPEPAWSEPQQRTIQAFQELLDEAARRAGFPSWEALTPPLGHRRL